MVSSIVGLALVVWYVYLRVKGEPVSLELAAPFGIAVGIISTVVLLYEKHLWKWPAFNLLVSRPNLSGTWQVDLKSTFKSSTGAPVEKKAFVVIKQSLNTLSFRLYTDTARSQSVAETVSQSPSKLFSMSILYNSVPSMEFREGSPIHFGAAHFDHIDNTSETIEGHYWTDQNTAGSIVLKKRVHKFVTSYQAAEKLFPAT